MKSCPRPRGSSRWSTILIAAPALLGATAYAPTSTSTTLAPTGASLLVRAHIDGRSRLVLDGDSAQWLHFDYAAPGRHRCDAGARFEPTVLGETQWYPEWPDVPDCENRGCNCASDVFTGLDPALPNALYAATLELIDSRGECSIVEHPTHANGFRVVIEFDDNSIPGDAWYEVVLHVSDCEAVSYCISTPNSTGESARLALGGALSITQNDCWLEATHCPPGQFGLFIYGRGRAEIPMGDGYLCISPYHPGLVRLNPAVQFDAQGRADREIDFPTLPVGGTIEPGSTWCFQVWYRDQAAGGAGYNFSDAVEVTFCP